LGILIKLTCSAAKNKEKSYFFGDKNGMLLKAAVSHPLEFPERHHHAPFSNYVEDACVHTTLHTISTTDSL
jgi:hypothetical protein